MQKTYISTQLYKDYLKGLKNPKNTKFRNEHEYNKAMGIEKSNKKEPIKKREVLNDLNPTGGVFVKYKPQKINEMELGKNITTLDKTMGRPANEKITIYRGTTKNQNKISPGDFITTNEQLAKSYAGNGHVLKEEVYLSDVLDDKTESLGEEYIYKPKKDNIMTNKKIAKKLLLIAKELNFSKCYRQK